MNQIQLSSDVKALIAGGYSQMVLAARPPKVFGTLLSPNAVIPVYLDHDK